MSHLDCNNSHLPGVNDKALNKIQCVQNVAAKVVLKIDI